VTWLINLGHTQLHTVSKWLIQARTRSGHAKECVTGAVVKQGIALNSCFTRFAPQYLEMLKALTEEDGEQKDVDELDRLFRLEDPRGR